jgi:hypothetical protein
MPIDRDTILQRIDELLARAKQGRANSPDEAAARSGTVHILENLYGPNSHKCRSFVEEMKSLVTGQRMGIQHQSRIVGLCKGVLESVKAEVTSGLLGNIESQAQGEVFGDFITLAREALDKSKDVAAVLVSAALEDTLKKFALQNGLDIDDADMAQVINALKSQSLLKGPQASVVQSYVKLRNKAFHAEWDKIEKETVNSAISFTETFLIKHFS